MGSRTIFRGELSPSRRVLACRAKLPKLGCAGLVGFVGLCLLVPRELSPTSLSPSMRTMGVEIFVRNGAFVSCFLRPDLSLYLLARARASIPLGGAGEARVNDLAEKSSTAFLPCESLPDALSIVLCPMMTMRESFLGRRSFSIKPLSPPACFPFF